jgi:hypothetical protein
LRKYAPGTIFEQETGTRIVEKFDRRVAVLRQMEAFHVENCKYLNWEDGHSVLYPQHRCDLFRIGILGSRYHFERVQ